MTDTKAGPPSYKVGYGQPPVEHQFKKGQSGNSNRRRKRSVPAVLHVAKALNEFVVVQEKGEHRSLSKLAIAAKQLVNKAVSGDLRAWKCLLEMMETPECKRMNETIQQSLDGNSAQEIFMQRIEQISARMDATESRDPNTPDKGFYR